MSSSWKYYLLDFSLSTLNIDSAKLSWKSLSFPNLENLDSKSRNLAKSINSFHTMPMQHSRLGPGTVTKWYQLCDTNLLKSTWWTQVAQCSKNHLGIIVKILRLMVQNHGSREWSSGLNSNMWFIVIGGSSARWYQTTNRIFTTS